MIKASINASVPRYAPVAWRSRTATQTFAQSRLVTKLCFELRQTGIDQVIADVCFAPSFHLSCLRPARSTAACAIFKFV